MILQSRDYFAAFLFHAQTHLHMCNAHLIKRLTNNHKTVRGIKALGCALGTKAHFFVAASTCFS
jgi:hypothetical protein